MKIAFFDSKGYDERIFKIHNKNFNFELRFFQERLTEQSAVLAKGFDVVCIFVADDASELVVNQLYSFGVKLIALRCAGYNNVNFEAAQGKLQVVHVPAYSPNSVAEFTILMILTLIRKIHKAYNRTRDLNFALQGLLGYDLCNKTVGLIGTGRIARVFIEILMGFKCKVIAYDLYPDHDYAQKVGFEYMSQEDVFKNSDIISLHCPLTRDNHYLINRETLNIMRDDVIIVNTGRGKLINTLDLIDALKTGKVGGAALDVYEEENEYFYEDFSLKGIGDDVLSRLIMFPNVLVTSHQAYFTEDALGNIATTTLGNIQEFVDQKTMTNELAYVDGTKGWGVKRIND
ncbi:2-hydroxyacid dehydrogenase [Desulfosediminicola sp.]|uniref:2-hydroxyacid dehydrogenase n=1 Tax=Desulfosediminicola sp. TaxID=2886825 RepID=UPI003AF29F83